MTEHLNPKVSVIVPALNEERNIERTVDDVLSAFQKMNVSGEIIVVNDGSTDKTADVIKTLMNKYPFIRLIDHPTPQGVGASYWEAVKASRGELVTWVPGDGETYCFEILRYIPLFEDVDIIVPFVFNPDVRSIFRVFLSKTYKGIINLSFGTLLNYMNGTTLYRRCVLEDINLRSTGFFFQVELLIKSINKGYLYAEVPSALGVRVGGASKAISFKSLLAVSRGYLSLLFSYYFFSDPPKPLHPDSVSAKRRHAHPSGRFPLA